MKKLTFLVALLAISVMSFAQGKITYVLNGGTVNEYGWSTPDTMFHAFMTDAGAADFKTLAYYKTQSDPLGSPNICTALTDASPALTTEKWAWLKAHIEAAHVAQAAAGASALPADGTGAAWRYAVGAFFIDGQRTGWPKSADFTAIGVSAYDAYKDLWKSGWVGPAEYAEGETVDLENYKPYPANPTEESFLGWFKDEACTEEIKEISGTGDVTIYALFGEYIPKCAEVAAMADDSITKVGGTVTLVLGKEFWIEDATGGLLCFQDGHGLVAGEKVVLKGTKVTYGGIAELKNITVEKHEAAKAVTPQQILISDVVNDTIGKYTSELVQFVGVRVNYKQSGEYTDVYLSDGENSVRVYKLTLDQNVVPENAKVTATVVVSYYNGALQFRGAAEGITVAAAAGRDTYAYPEVTDSISGYKFNLTNNWLYSQNLQNWNENKPNPLAEGSRSILQKDGILYFAYRESNNPVNRPYIARVDVKTGKMLSPVFFADSLMKKNGAYIFGPFSDMKMDNAGNVITSNLPTGGGDFQVWTVDLETGGGKLLINHTEDGAYLKELLPDITAQIRIDRISVYGDITKDATVMTIIASSSDVLYWNIVDGEWDGEVNWIKLQMDGNVGGAPTICAIADNYFYIDGNSTYAMLFDPDGNLVDNLADYPELLLNRSDKSHSIGNCGVLEIAVPNPASEDGFDYYFVCAGDAHGVGAPAPSCFLLYKFKDANRSFGEMQKLYEFPHAGMGDQSNPQRVAVPYATVAEDGNSIEIYVFVAENGYGVYTLNIEQPGTALENVEANTANVQKVVRDGQVIIIRDNVEYNVLGTQVK